MDKQTCRVCNKTFDFDTEGLATTRQGKPFLVCSVDCAKTAATTKGNAYAIHDDTGDIVEHNIEGR